MKKLLLLPLIIFISFLFFANFVQANTTIDPTGPGSFKELIEAFIEIIRNIVAPLAAVMVIIAGILYATSAGNPERIQQAKDFLIYAIIGVIIVLIAQAVITTIEGFF